MPAQESGLVLWDWCSIFMLMCVVVQVVLWLTTSIYSCLLSFIFAFPREQIQKNIYLLIWLHLMDCSTAILKTFWALLNCYHVNKGEGWHRGPHGVGAGCITACCCTPVTLIGNKQWMSRMDRIGATGLRDSARDTKCWPVSVSLETPDAEQTATRWWGGGKGREHFEGHRV